MSRSASAQPPSGAQSSSCAHQYIPPQKADPSSLLLCQLARESFVSRHSPLVPRPFLIPFATHPETKIDLTCTKQTGAPFLVRDRITPPNSRHATRQSVHWFKHFSPQLPENTQSSSRQIGTLPRISIFNSAAHSLRPAFHESRVTNHEPRATNLESHS